MKCPTCGANLQIEDEKCPFCGNPNPFAIKHRQDMQYYHNEFQKTRQEVERKTVHFTSAAVKIPIIVILLILILVIIFSKDEINYALRRYNIRNDIRKNEQEYLAHMNAYESNGDWVGLYTLYSEKNLHYSDSFDEYRVVEMAAFEYKLILYDIMNYSEEEKYNNAEMTASRIAESLDDFWKYVYRTYYYDDYYDDCYAPVHQDALERMEEDMDALLFAYCHLTQEEIDEMPDYSVSKKNSMIEEALKRRKAGKLYDAG